MAHETTVEQARAFARGVLPRVSRTFAINIELLSGDFREAVRLAYLLCRAADALEDSWPGRPGEIAERFATFRAALAGDRALALPLARGAAARAGARADLKLVAELPALLTLLDALPPGDRGILVRAVDTMAAGMSRYAAREAERGPDVCYVDDEAELRDYCWIVAGCIGVMLTELFERRLPRGEDPARERRHALAPIVGEALQLTNILLDWPTDVPRGRCYLPANWLAAHGLTPATLAAGAPRAREIAIRLEALAHAALDRVPDYLDTIPPRHVRYRIFCLWPALWARASLRLAHREPRFPTHADRPKLSRGELWGSAARSLLVVRSHRGVRRLLATR